MDKSLEGEGRNQVTSFQELYEKHPTVFQKKEIRKGVSIFVLDETAAAPYLSPELSNTISEIKSENDLLTRGGFAPELFFLNGMFPMKAGKKAAGARVGNNVYMSLTENHTPTQIYHHEKGYIILKRDGNFRGQMITGYKALVEDSAEYIASFKQAYRYILSTFFRYL